VADEDVKELTYDFDNFQVRLRRRHGDARPSCAEEALAAWVLSRRLRRRVLELGAGAGLAGLAAANSAKHVELTDADPAVVQTLQEAVLLNDSCAASLKARRLAFGEVPALKRFDWIIAAEIVEMKDAHALILRTARKLLKPSGTFAVMAAGPIMDCFLREAAATFPSIELKRDFPDAVSKALHGMTCRPKMALLRRPAVRLARRPPKPPKDTKAPSPSPESIASEDREESGEEEETEQDMEVEQAVPFCSTALNAASPACKPAQAVHPGSDLRALPRSRERFRRPVSKAEARSPRTEPTVSGRASEDGCVQATSSPQRLSGYPTARGDAQAGGLQVCGVRPLIRRAKSVPYRGGKLGGLMALPSEP
ncbi:unnamed protein product, partial [Effrenium voratum]